MASVLLPPDLERFAVEAVASGRYRDITDVVRDGLDMVRRRDQARTDFLASLEAAQRDGEQNGLHNLDDVLAELDAIIAEEERAKA